MKLSDKNKKLLVKALAFIIPFITILIGFIIGGFAPFGNKDIMTAAGYEDMLPYLTEFHDLVSSGNPFVYSNRIGTGYDFSAVITYYLSDPINMIILIFPKASMLAVLDILYIVKISLAGLFAFLMFSYLSNVSNIKNESTDSKKIDEKDSPFTNMSFLNLGLSLAYALSSAMVGYGMNITWLSAMAILPLVIMGLEKIIRERKPVMYLVTFGISIVCCFNMAVIIFIFSLLYLIRSEYKSTRHIFITLLYKLAADILAIGVTAFIVFNNINSSFFKNNVSIHFPKGTYPTNLFDYIISFMTSSPVSATSSFGNGADIYAGIFVVFFTILYIQNKKINIWSKIRSLSVLAILLLGTFVTTFQYVLNGFNSSYLTRSIFGFTLALYGLIIVHDTLSEIESLNMRNIIISGVLSTVLIIMTMIKCSGYDSASMFVTSIEVILALTIVSLILKNKNINLAKFSIIIFIVISAELIYSNISNVSALGNKALAYNQTVTCAADTCIDAIHEADPSARILVYEPYHTDATPVSESILGYDYIIITEDTDAPDSNLEYIGDMYGLHIFTNPDAVKDGVFMTPDIISWDSANEFYFSAINIFTRDVLNTENVFTQIECNTTIDNETYSDASLISYNTRESGDFYTNLSNVIHIGDIQAGKPATIKYSATFEDNNASINTSEYALYDKDAYQTMLGEITKASSSNSNLFNTKISVDAPDDGFVMLPVNLTRNSKISINSNGGTSETVQSKRLFSSDVTLIKVASGKNDIEIKYTPVCLIKGAIISIICLIIVILSIIVLKSKKLSEIIIDSNNNKFESFIYDNRVYIYTMLISTLLYLIVACFNQATPFGAGSIIVSDGYLEIYPTFMHRIYSIKHLHFSTIDYCLGFMGGGLNIESFIMFINPLRIIPLLFPTGSELLAFNTLYAVEYILIGPSMLIYLTHRPHGGVMQKTELKLIPIALCYNLSSYVLCYYSFAGFLEMALIFPIIMLALDRMIYEKKYIAYTVLLSLFMIDSTYMAFLMCEFLALYFFTMDHGSIKKLIQNGIRFALCSITSALMAIFVLLPFYGSVSNTKYSDYDSNTYSATMNIFTQNIIGNLRDTEVLHRLSLVTEQWNIANTYCGLLLMLIIPIYLLNKEIKLSIRIRNILLVFLLYFSYGNEVLNFVFHGFHKQASVPNRFAPFLIFMVICILYELILNYKEIFDKKKLIAYSVFSIIIASATLYNHTSDTRKMYLATILFIAIYLGGYIYYYIKKKHYRFIRYALAVLSIELMITSTFTALHVWGIETVYETNMGKLKTLSAKYNLSDDNLMHTEVLNIDNVNSSCLIGTNSISEFSSTLPSEKTMLVEYWSVRDGMNVIQYETGNPLANIMLNTKYFYNNIFSDDTESPAYFENNDELSNIVMYKDPYVVGSGTYIDDSLELNKLDKKDFQDEFEFQNYISNVLVGQNLYDIVEFTSDESQLDENHSYILMGETDEYQSTPLRLYISSEIKGTLYLDYDGFINYLGGKTGDNQETYDIAVYEPYENLLEINKHVKVAVLNTDTIEKISTYIDSTRIKDLKADDAIISGTSDKTTSGTLYIPLPNYSNWHAYIDDAEVEKLDYMGGIGIHIPEGKHDIKLVYESENNTLPYILSLIFIILFITFCIIDKHRSKKTEKVNDQ